MNAAKEIYDNALAETAQAFSIPLPLVEKVVNASYDRKPLDAGAELVAKHYHQLVSDYVGPIVAEMADAAARRDRARNSGSGSGTKPPAKTRPRKQNPCASGQCSTG